MLKILLDLERVIGNIAPSLDLNKIGFWKIKLESNGDSELSY